MRSQSMGQEKKELVFSGVQPSGAQVHIGNYLGAMKRFVTLAKKHPTIVCIVDLHALTSVEKSEDLRNYTMSLACAYLAIGIDPKETIIFRQSDVIEVCELTWYLACQFPLGLLERAHSIKDARAKGQSVNSGLMFYPVLMAADILLYRSTKVPVGADQKQHLEMTREVAEKFNSRFGEVFPLPEPLIEEDTGVIVGLDGRKMSKSYGNFIGLFEESDSIKKKVMSIVTDSKKIEEKKDPTTCNVFNLYKLFGTPEEIQALKARYESPGMSYGFAKEELFKVIEREISPLRERYQMWQKRPSDVKDVLTDGGKRAAQIANETIESVRVAVGIR